jgi:hypothetical protein
VKFFLQFFHIILPPTLAYSYNSDLNNIIKSKG